MNKAQIILDFLFPSHQQAAGAVGPGMRCFYNPASGAVPRSASSVLFISAANMRLIAAAPGNSQRGLAEVAFVEAEMLPAATARARPLHRNRTQRGLQKFLIVSVGSGNRNSQRNAATVSEHRSL